MHVTGSAYMQQEVYAAGSACDRKFVLYDGLLYVSQSVCDVNIFIL